MFFSFSDLVCSFLFCSVQHSGAPYLIAFDPHVGSRFWQIALRTHCQLSKFSLTHVHFSKNVMLPSNHMQRDRTWVDAHSSHPIRGQNPGCLFRNAAWRFGRERVSRLNVWCYNYITHTTKIKIKSNHLIRFPFFLFDFQSLFILILYINESISNKCWQSLPEPGWPAQWCWEFWWLASSNFPMRQIPKRRRSKLAWLLWVCSSARDL